MLTRCRTASLFFLTLFTLWAGGCTEVSTGITPRAGKGRVVTDLSGRRVTIPARVDRVACLEVLGYEKMFLLGQTDKIALMYASNAPWMERTNPKVKEIPSFVGEPNFEELLRRQIPLAFFRYNPEQTAAKLSALGIPGLVSQPLQQGWGSAGEFTASTKQALRLYGEVLGAAASAQAELWCSYYDARIRYVTGRISRLPQAGRPRVYYLRGPDALTTQGAHSNTAWYGEMAGADMFNKQLGAEGKGTVSLEELVRWNPEYIFVGRQYSRDLVLQDPRWRDLKAVREGKVISLPEGVFFWDGSTEGVLLMEFLAKTLHPDLFRDLDMAKEIKDYYRRFYRYPLSDDEADKILRGLSPDGRQVNSLRN